MSQESSYIRNNRGLWGKSNVPHKGWSCIATDDLEDNTTMCEMCQSQEIRFTHTMYHPDYPSTLTVGCICAGNMEQDLQTALKRDQRMRKKADAYKRLPHLKWKYSYSGNPYIKYHGFIATVFKKKGPQIYSNNLGFGIIIKHKDSCYSRFSERYYPSKDQAKLEALKTILKVEEKYGEDYDKWLTKGQFETDLPYG